MLLSAQQAFDVLRSMSSWSETVDSDHGKSAGVVSDRPGALKGKSVQPTYTYGIS